ncbi:pyridoxamine kinase [Lactobacillus sp. ESL0791]|uniref:pyridoxamine kinase n=1 Tax=Lactobacillus sp. ESL0791 TaxID=2983234 RepID=UPI0023FA21C0|nr:pyridoxamine kinase [Lactobacillus sp. ESL0791]MDF7639499.1 pyridoxamine kinase [Lactobacillus sp. ESL0791]
MNLDVLISQDISCIGQVSLVTVLPILAASGGDVSVLPTALLSTHTGGFGDNTYLDLSAEMTKIFAHWQDLQVKFNSIYLGYLGMNALKKWHSSLSKISNSDSIILIDPVMGDHGKLYHGFNAEYVEQMQKLIMQATVITPNLTEASFLLDRPELAQADLTAAPQILKQLAERFAVKQIVITGINCGKEIAIVGSDDGAKNIWQIVTPKINGNYFGSGDIFAAALLAGILHKQTLKNAAKAASTFIGSAIKDLPADRDQRLGINYASSLPAFIEKISSNLEE